MSSMESLERVQTLLAFFRDELVKAFERLDVQTSEGTEAYLVYLLDEYAKVDEEKAAEIGFHKPAASLLEEAISSEGERRIEVYRRLGDVSLYSCGFFQACLRKKAVGSDYYHRMGRTAYCHVRDLMVFKEPGGIFAQIFDELATNFDRIVDAFHLVRSQRAHREHIGGLEVVRSLDEQEARQLFFSDQVGFA